jgi:hypothetical protein
LTTRDSVLHGQVFRKSPAVRQHRPADPRRAFRKVACTAIAPPAAYSCGAAPSSDLLDQLHLRAVGRGTHLKRGTAICLIVQRDTIQTAKLVASLDQLSKRRFLFGIGCGWNGEEMEDYGTVYETRTLKTREQIEAMKEIWTKDVAEYHGQIVDFPPMNSWPKPVQKPHPPVAHDARSA